MKIRKVTLRTSHLNPDLDFDNNLTIEIPVAPGVMFDDTYINHLRSQFGNDIAERIKEYGEGQLLKPETLYQLI